MGDMRCVLIMVVLSCVSLPGRVVGQDDGTLKEIDMSTWQQAYNENQKLLVLLYRPEGCDSCPMALDSVSQIIGQPEIPSAVEIAKSSDLDLSSKLQVTEFPALVYLRDKSHVLYDGKFDVEDLLEWIQLAGEKVTHRLTQDTFEHLTQASTGATTGDWLVAFYKETCKGILTVMETLGVRIKGKMNVAKVNAADSPGLVDRFKVTKCPEVIFFKQGKMYRYDFPSLDAISLRSFVDGFYKNVKAESIPLPKSQFDFVTENIADYIKGQMQGENKMVMMAALVGGAVVFMVVIICCCRSLLQGPAKEKTE